MANKAVKQDEKLAKSFYDRISGAYDLLANANEQAAREKGLELLAVGEGEQVLEIGYGTGHSLAQMAKSVGPSGRVTGIDISDGMRQVSEKRIRDDGLADRVQFDVAAVPPLPYNDGSFDVVTMSFTLELFPLGVIPRMLAEIRRVLVPGGRLGVVSMATTPDGEQDSLLEETYKWMHRHFPHIVDCQPIDAVGLLRKAGFEVTQRADMKIWTMPVVAAVGVVQKS